MSGISREELSLDALGNKTTYHFEYNPDLLETFDNRHPDTDYFVKFNVRSLPVYVRLPTNRILQPFISVTFRIRNWWKANPSNCTSSVFEIMVISMKTVLLRL